MRNFFKKNKENLIIFCIFLIIFILLSVFCYEIYLRFFFSLIFLCKSIGYYFCRVFLIETSTPYDPYQYTLDHFQQGVTTLLPTNSNVFLTEIKASFFIIFNKTYFLNSFSSITFIFTYFNLIMTLIIIFVCIIVISRQLLLIQRNSKLIGDSNFLRKYKNFKAKKIDKLVAKLNLIKFKIKKFKILFLIISLLFSNVGAVITDTISYLLISLANILLLPINLYHFIFSSYTALYSQLYFIPTFIWILVILFVFYKLRINHAKNKICSLQDKNEDFAVNNLGIATLTTGVMGAGKDSFNAAVSLTMQRVFKRQRLEVMLKYKALFRNFDFISYERYIKKAEENRYFSSSVQIKFMFEKYKNLLSQKKIEEASKLLEEYNFPKEFLNYENSEFFNGLEPLTIIDMLQVYGQCYFLYSSIRPNIYSNIAMRIPFRYLNEEYFPIFDFDIYNDKDVITYKESTHYCRIWNFDWRRLGNRFFANSGVSDCGIYNFSEGGKERGNMFTNSGKDKLDYEPNQKNDEFNKFVKLIRHLYTIDNTPYVKLLVNDQRIGSINADLSELFETTVSLKKEKKVKNSLFLYNVFDKVILNAILNPINNLLQDYRQTRNYESLFSSFLSYISNKITVYKTRCESLFNYRELKIKVNQTGGIDNDTNVSKFFLIYKEVYAGTYATDCYFMLFEPLIEKKENKIFDQGDYVNKYASLDDFHKQNSLLINDIEDCKAFHPKLSESEFESKYKFVIKEALNAYPEIKLRDIFKNLKVKYGKEIGSYSDFLKFSKKYKLYDEKARKKSKKE